MTIIRDASVYRVLQNNLALNSTKLNDYYVKSSTGIEVSRASEEPSSVRSIISFRSEILESDRYVASGEAVQDSLASTEVYVDAVVDILDRAKEIAVAAANGSLSTADFATYRQELNEMEDALLDIANTQVENKYIFAGYNDTQIPFSGDPVTYNGTTDHQMVEVSPGIEVAKNITGDELFMNPVNLFVTLDDLESALVSGDETQISAQLQAIEEAAEQVRGQQGKIGVSNARIDDIMNMQANYNLMLEEQLSERQDADLTEILSEITKMEISLELTMEVTGRVSSLNLFRYL